MPIRIDPEEARSILEDAVRRARSSAPLPEEWIQRTRAIGDSKSKTYVAALATALLARATERRIDPMSIKATPDQPRAYSARSLCHGVLVPASRQHGFDLGATGREPLNNQPFFRYERMDQMDRVGDTAGLNELQGSLRRIGRLSSAEARNALAAFVRIRLEVSASKQRVDLRGIDVGAQHMIEAAHDFINEDAEGGKRGQALVAAAFDLGFEEVRMGRVNDPSRRFPGDVQVLSGAQILLAAEVRQKHVGADDVIAFAEIVQEAGVANAAMVALHPDHDAVDRYDLLAIAEERHGVLMSVIESVDELIGQALMWCGTRIDEALEELPRLYGDRLEEIEVSRGSVARWRDALSPEFRSL